MTGLTYRAGAQHLRALGLRYVDEGNGSPQDYEVVKARKEHACSHVRPGGYRLPQPCQHPTIGPGEVYVRVSAGWLDTDPVAMPCAVAAGWYAPAPDPGTPPERQHTA